MRKLYGILILVFFTSSGYAQTKNISYDYITMEDGLSDNRVITLLEDKRGYIWIGSQGGIVRYDGYGTKTYPLKGISSTDEGPKTIAIGAIYQDKQGILWVGTRYEGLFWYDTANDRFVACNYSGKDQQSTIQENWIRQIEKDKAGNLWFITHNRKNSLHELYYFNPKTKALRSYNNTLPGRGKIEASRFYTLFKDSQEQIWLGTNNGLYRYNAPLGNFTGFLTSSGQTQNKRITFIYEAPSEPGILWLGSRMTQKGEAGLMRFAAHPTKKQDFKLQEIKSERLSSDTVYTVFEDHKKQLWIGTNNGLSLLNRQNGQIKNYTPQDLKNQNVYFSNIGQNIGQNSAYHITEDSRGNFWLVTGKGLIYFKPQTDTFSRFTAEEEATESLQTENFNFFIPPIIDKAGSFWVGSLDRGLIRVNNQRSQYQFLKNYSNKPQSYPGGSVYEIAPGKYGIYWLATQKGLVEWNKLKNNFKLISLINDSEVNKAVNTVVVDKDGLVWCSIGQSGIYRYNPKTGEIKNYRNNPNDPTSLSFDYVWRLFIDRKNQLWIGTYGGGLCKFNKETNSFTRYPFKKNPGFTKINGKSLDDSQILSLFEDRKGNLWVGTNLGGLNLFNPKTGTFTSYLNPAKQFQCIRSIYEDKAGRFWVGTRLFGLFQFDPQTGKTKRYTQQNGLLADIIVDILEDNASYIWFATARGLSRFNPENQTFTSFTKANGLPETQFIRSGLKTEENEFLLCTVQGLVVFNPADIKPNQVPPTTIIQTINYPDVNPRKNKILEQTIHVAGQKEIKLEYNQNRLTFNYVGLHYDNPTLNKYSYILEGNDQNWVLAGTQRSATYAKLPPGNYTFRVKAANVDGIWNKTATSISITILPPWWRTWWAYAGFALLFAVALRTYIYYRSRALRLENQELENKVNRRTAELSQANKELSSQRDQLSYTLNKLKATQTQLVQSEKMASLGELMAGIAHEIQNPLNFVNNFSEISTELVEELEEEVVAGNNEEVVSLAGDLKQNLQKINHHGHRADSIVKGMLQHSRVHSGEKQLTDINALADKYLRLSYQGFRTKDNSFQVEIITDFAPDLVQLEVVPPDVGRALLNIFNNAFYAVQQQNRYKANYNPQVTVSTKNVKDGVEVRVKDNGTGMPPEVLTKIFQPFFTTKPTGQGTGLGLSLSYDIITKGHGGELKVETKEGEGSDFIIVLPHKQT